jgi:hypothetical protein
MALPTLESDLVDGNDLQAYFDELYGDGGNDTGDTWKMLKATKGNCGQGVYVVNRQNYQSVLDSLNAREKEQPYVAQEFLRDPALFEGRKFHLRCYAVLMGDFRAFLYSNAFVLCASQPYNPDSDETFTQLTNLSLNKQWAHHPGQLPVHLPSHFPDQFRQLGAFLSELFDQALPYMQVQLQPTHYEMLGVDVLINKEGVMHVCELNRLPGLSSSKQNRAKEDRFYDEMLLRMFRLVLGMPHVSKVSRRENEQAKEEEEEEEEDANIRTDGRWESDACWHRIREPSLEEITFEPTQAWKNVMKRRMMIKKQFKK